MTMVHGCMYIQHHKYYNNYVHCNNYCSTLFVLASVLIDVFTC